MCALTFLNVYWYGEINKGANVIYPISNGSRALLETPNLFRSGERFLHDSESVDLELSSGGLWADKLRKAAQELSFSRLEIY